MTEHLSISLLILYILLFFQSCQKTFFECVFSHFLAHFHFHISIVPSISILFVLFLFSQSGKFLVLSQFLKNNNSKIFFLCPLLLYHLFCLSPSLLKKLKISLNFQFLHLHLLFSSQITLVQMLIFTKITNKSHFLNVLRMFCIF